METSPEYKKNKRMVNENWYFHLIITPGRWNLKLSLVGTIREFTQKQDREEMKIQEAASSLYSCAGTQG